MIKAILFDCYGVLAEDGWSSFRRRYIGDNTQALQVLSDLGKQNEYGMMDNNTYYQEASKIMGVDEATLREAISRQVPNEDLFEYIATSLKPKYKIGLISNANYDVTNELFTPKQSRLFDASVLSYECRMIKPDPEMFLLIAEKLGVQPKECIFVDDIESYCIAAENLGMKAVVYKDVKQCISELDRLL